MPSIELSKLQAVTAPRALSDTDRAATKPSAESKAYAPSADAPVTAGVAIDVSTKVDPSNPPVNTDRVAEIRDALKDGSYPLVPAEIADAMIAAQLSFGISE